MSMGSGLWLGARSAASDGSDGPTRLSGAGAEGGEKVTIIMNNSRTSVRTLSRIIPVSVVAGGGGVASVVVVVVVPGWAAAANIENFQPYPEKSCLGRYSHRHTLQRGSSLRGCTESTIPHLPDQTI